ncbi:DNA polymerase-3 subunit alpha [Sphingobium sp. OAS761]|uniref:DNA polymerase III subunit alpha n=1 Tax=Sphingobium sp. OAS761 TaxID=2817901 RepID=UPI00209F4EE6|nr:DNA polymerase III subunit alpha [Sphingobium sp. OAS761]MCP1469840.1 DNA polymerase-3 subunit alpha [Sphingobium sp. OAS761]
MLHASFVPLRIFSSFTMLEGAIDPKKIAKQARALGFPAAAITDRNGLYGAMAFSDACRGEGVQPIIGAMLGVARPGRPANAAPVHDWLALYAQDATGYDNICDLVSKAHLDRPVDEVPHVSIEMLEGRTEGVIALTAGAEGALARLFAEDQPEAAMAYVDRLQALFPERLYVEICRRLDPVEGSAEPRLLDLAYDRGLPLVATNPTCFAEPDFHKAHDVMLCIAEGAYVETPDRKTSSPDAWMKPMAEMKRLFEDLPEALANTLVVAQRCAVAAPKRKPILPSLAGDREGEERMLREQATAGLEARLEKAGIIGEEARRPYFERLRFETDIIIQMGFPGYFLIVADFIKWAKDHDIPVGPGRGSGAGSVVAWALTITDLDPLQLGLLFERFLNPERVSMPDFDIDFCETRRGEVIRYVQQKYGTDHVAQIITFGKLKARAVLKDTGRVLQMSYGQVDRLAKLVPNHPTDPWTLERTLEKGGVAEFRHEYENDKQVRRLIDYAMKLEGFPRHSSTHAAGVVIGDRPLSQLVPLYRDPRSDMPVTQFDMKYVEGAGLVKFDFLGLKTLSVLQKAVQLLAQRGVTVDLDSLAWDDPAVYDLLQRGDTVGVFQLESEGMRKTLAAVRPTNFGDIIALVSLYRPGPMDNIPMFGRRKNGQEDIEYPHILLKPILEETYGIFVYQEQVMQAAQILAGYSLGDADLLRRAMGKKIKAEMDAQRARFVEGCASSDIPAAKANELFDLIDKFAGYGFNKSHAAAYALLAYQTAWLKAHYPAEFYAGSMAFDIHLTDKLTVFVDDMRRMGLTCLPPDLNRSEADFMVEPVAYEGDDPRLGFAVRYALGGLKGVGEKAMEQLVAEREAAGPFKNLDDVADRIEPRLLNRRQLESLAAAGAFDGIHADRAGVHAAAETILSVAASNAHARESGQGGLFGDVETPHADVRIPPHQAWTVADRMAQEKEAFGFYFSAHPVDRYKHLADARGAKSYGLICQSPMPAPNAEGRAITIMAAMVEDVRWRETKRGARYANATFSDQSGQFQASCFDEDGCKAIEDLARDGDCALLVVELDRLPGEETPRVTVRGVEPFRQVASASRMELVIDAETAEAVTALAGLLGGAGGGRSEVFLRAPLGDGRAARLFLGDHFSLGADQVDAMATLPGIAIHSFKRMDVKADGYRTKMRRSGLRLVG